MLQNPPDDICTLKDLQTHIQKVRSFSKCPSFLSTFKKQRFSFEGDDKISTGDMLIYIIGLAIVKNNREYKRELLGLLVGVPGTSKSTFLTLREEYPRLWDIVSARSLNFFYRQHKVKRLTDVEIILIKNKTLREEYPLLWILSPRLLNMKKIILNVYIWQLRVAFRRMSQE